MKIPNLYLKTAIQAATEAGKIQKRHYGKDHTIRFKGQINLVTEVDVACEKKIISILKKKFPDHDFLMEESGSAGKKSDYRWIVDPLDGTTNFAHGYPVFAVSIALEYRGRVIVGVVYDPTRDELFWSIRGRGAWLNRKRIHVSKTKELRRALLSTGFAYNVWHETKNNNLDHFSNFLKNSQAVRRDGAAAIDICYVACGRYDGFWEMGLKPWDIAAASLILEEAGGTSTLFNGKFLDLFAENIVSSNLKIHSAMVKILQKGRVHGRIHRR